MQTGNITMASKQALRGESKNFSSSVCAEPKLTDKADSSADVFLNSRLSDKVYDARCVSAAAETQQGSSGKNFCGGVN